ncbi:hypothetical protein JRQ81_001088 [Phrynocephalus forsythii]|uniref:Serpin domain-containing protein n=1 Tax=Phrynocephalus forsythii TaxID=171643 RepID=A0A9Q1B7L4_9SAUR|nr:hypothetical protein JRQ81_001088 [Phrynocephalus forsythii]
MANFYVALLLAGLQTLAFAHHTPVRHEKETEAHLSAEHAHTVPYLKLAPSNADFAFKFYREVASGAAQRNIFFSPLSITAAFSMVALGAKSNTLRQLWSGLGFNQLDISEHELHECFRHLLHVLNNPNADIELNMGGALFIDEKLQPLKKFLDEAQHFYESEISQTPLKNPEEAMNQINSYIEEKTHGKLQDVIKGLDPEAVMVLVNYLFMKAYWRNPFSYEVTREEDFFVDKRTTVRVPMMHRKGVYKTYHDTDLSCQVVEVPYKGSASALFILPDPGKMKQVEDSLNKDVLFKWLNSVRPGRIDLYLPRFSISGSYDVKAFFQKLGVTDLFENHADLSGITGKPELKVSKAIIYLLLFCVQVNCYHLSGHQKNQDGHREDSALKRKRHLLDKQEKTPTGSDKMASIRTDFAFRLYNHVISGAADKNVFLSPLSISTAFAVLALGANSETKGQLLKGLGFNLSEIEEEEIHEGFHDLLHNRPYAKSEVTTWTEPEVNIGNALFIEESLKPRPEFSKDVKALYEAESFSCNFSNYIGAEKQINNYIMNKTKGKIPHSVERLDQSTVMVLVNYITFKADWKLAFDTASTMEEDFFVDANRTVKVSLMSQEGFYKYLRDEDLSSWVVAIDFRGDGIADTYRDDITAFFILPDEGKMKHLEGALLKENVSKWAAFFRISDYEGLHLYIPKFTISSSYNLKDIMEKLGVTDIFNNNADLSGINGERNLKLSKIVHKAVLDLRESGTKDETVTTFWSWPQLLPISSPPVLKFNKPYMMVITDKKANIIFLAKMVDPTEGQT